MSPSAIVGPGGGQVGPGGGQVGPGVPGTTAPGACTDAALLAEIQLALVEDATFSTALWSLAEVVRYMNQRQTRFLVETKCLTAWTTLQGIPGQALYDLPSDWIATVAAAWHDLTTGLWTPLPATDSFELDHLSHDYASTTGTPQGYSDGDTPALTVALGPAPHSAGEVELLYVSLSEVLDGLGQLFSVPCDWLPYMKYGTMADMLSKQGRGQDLLRARYCEVRYQEGIVLATALLEGFR